MPSGHLNGKTKKPRITAAGTIDGRSKKRGPKPVIPKQATNYMQSLKDKCAADIKAFSNSLPIGDNISALDALVNSNGLPLDCNHYQRKLDISPNERINRDLKYFKGMCKILCTEDEICGVLRTDSNTLDSWCKIMFNEGFSEIYKKLSKDGKMSLRRAQYRQAIEKDNPIMQIWLGKQYLGQADKLEQEVSGSLVLFAGQGELRDEEFAQNGTNNNEVIDITEVKELQESSIKPVKPDTAAL